MTNRLIAPPAHVWNRIEKILDEQDFQRSQGEKIIAETFVHAASRRRKTYLAAVTALGLLSGIIWSVAKII